MTPEARRAGRSPEKGVTLMELLVVLALLGVLMGLGVSMFTNLTKTGAYTATVSAVLSVVNDVRNSSQTAPAALQVLAGDPQKGEENGVRGIRYSTLFESQCEPYAAEGETEKELVGALGRNGYLPGTAVFVPGRIGKALHLSDGFVDCGNIAAYDATEGIALDVSLFPLSNRGGVVVARGSGFVLSLERRGEGLDVRLELAFAAGGTGAPGEKPESTVEERAIFETRDGGVRVGQWARIVVGYDRSNVLLSVDSGRGPVERVRQPETKALRPSRGENLTLGGGAGGATFHGYLDDVRLSGLIGGDLVLSPQGVQVLGPSRRIHFRGGKLDPAHHSRAETLTLRSGRKERHIVIGLEGNIMDK